MKSQFPSQIHARVLDQDDWHFIKEHMSNAYGERHHGGFILDGDDPEDPESWKRGLAQFITFGLFEKDKIIGTTSLILRPQEAVFCGSLIRAEERDKGYGDYLYDVRLRHLKEIGFKGVIKTSIWEENVVSMKVANRNGFKAVSSELVQGESWTGHLVELELTPGG